MLRIALFLTVVPLGWIALHVYMGRRLLNGPASKPIAPRVRRLGWALVALAAVIPPLNMVLGRTGVSLGEAWSLVAFTLMGLSSILLTFVLFADLLRFGSRALARLRARRGTPDRLPADPSRRAVLGGMVNLGMVGTATSLTGVGFAQARSLPDVVEVEVPIEDLPATADGFRIVQLTDVHIGPTIRGDFLEQVVDQVNALEPDMVAITGDLVDGFVPQLREHVAPLARLRARHGAYFVTGNHEYYWDGPAWCAELERLGLTVLCNEHRVVEHEGARLLVAGATDYQASHGIPGHASDPAAARAGAPACDVDILLAHQPRTIYAAAKAGYDLQISGHTHGGQYFPMNLLVHLVQPYVAGLHLHGATRIYVSRGTGYWGPPMRVGAPHEITVLRLVHQPSRLRS
jgi:uncharacterized protein